MKKILNFFVELGATAIVRVACWLSRVALCIAMWCFSEARLFECKRQIDEMFAEDNDTFEGIVTDMYNAASENNWLWLWKTAEVWEKFYKKASWIESV